MENKLTLGEKIKSLRKRAGISQFQLELEISLAQGSLSRIESGEVNPTKETLLKIIEELELNTYDAASLFDIDVQTELEKISKISSKIHEFIDLQEILDLITTQLVSLINLQHASVFVWDKNTRSLNLMSVNLPAVVRALCEKIMRIPLTSLKFYIDKEEDQHNCHVKSFIENTFVEIEDFRDITYPIIKNKSIDNILKNWLNFKYALIIPLSFNDNAIGVLGLLRAKKLTEGDYLVIKAFAEQAAMAIYNAQRYEKLQNENQKLLFEIKKLKNEK